jgi:hypothetical protein|tara:strand:- start:742 stop:1554 length:813 start_codon:yes stop_codon:yes gene_type:complete
MMINIEKIDNIFKEKYGRTLSGGKDRAMLLKEYGYKPKKDFRPQANLFHNDYEKDMVECKFCKHIGKESIHPYSMIKNFSFSPECENLEKYRNHIRTNEELKDSVSGRVLERILKMWQEYTGQPTYTQLEIEKYVNERYGETCFISGEKYSIQTDHIFPLKNGWPLIPKNACPLQKTYNSSKGAKLPKDFFSPEKLIELSEVSEYTLDELKTQTYNFPFWDWVDDNWDKVVEYIDNRKELKKEGGKEKFKNNIRKTIELTKRMRNNIDNI